MNQLTINLEALAHNIAEINRWMEDHGATWTLVSKVLCGHEDTLDGLVRMGVRSFGDSRLENLTYLADHKDKCESWYLRLPHRSAIEDVIHLTDVSLNSEIDIIQALDAEAREQGKIHRVIVMIELGDLREGILPGGLADFYEQIFDLPNIEVLGIGANLGCLSGSVPSVDQMMQLALYRELLELKFERKLPMISAGSSVTLPLLLEGSIPPEVNHFRIGEAVFLGTDLINGGVLQYLRDDAIMLEAEVVEVKEKSLRPLAETAEGVSPFDMFDNTELTPGQRGYRALVSVGQLDTDVKGLTPVLPGYQIAAASSDLTVVNVGEEQGGLQVGDNISFRVNYLALLRLMSSKYVPKVVTPGHDEIAETLAEESADIPPVLENIELPDNGEPG
jgi:predicted amino acid racemase